MRMHTRKQEKEKPLRLSEKLKRAELKLGDMLFHRRLDGIPRFSLAAGIEEVNRTLGHIIRAKMMTQGRKPNLKDIHVIIGVGGESGSGKSDLVKRIGCPGISLDDYYLDGIRKADWDNKNGLDFPRLISDLEKLKHGESIEKPVFSFRLGRRTGFERRDPAPVIAVEGLHALDERLLENYDLKVYVDVSRDVARTRVIARDVKERGRRAEDVEKHYREYVEPLADIYVRPTMKNADLIVENG